MKKNKQHCDLTVIDDFLPEGDFKRLKMIFDNPDFGWFRNDGISGSDATMSTTQSALDNYYFVHLLYLQYRAMSTYFDMKSWDSKKNMDTDDSDYNNLLEKHNLNLKYEKIRNNSNVA